MCVQTVNSAASDRRRAHGPPAIVLGVCGLHDSCADVFISLVRQPGSQPVSILQVAEVDGHRDAYSVRRSWLRPADVAAGLSLLPLLLFVSFLFSPLSLFISASHVSPFEPKHRPRRGRVPRRPRPVHPPTPPAPSSH